MKEKRKYEKPSMKVHELKQRARLLVGSVSATRGEDYGTAIEDTWQE